MSGTDPDERDPAERRDAEAFFDRFARVIDDAAGGLTDGVGATLELALLAPSHLRRAELSERGGDHATARELYARFAALWADGDPHTRELVRSAAERER